ncbi:MAG: oxidoreductase [Proteobacteria bacterium]|nr:MAG: oxidoreductase [Pseudomonadota bacterium]
MTCTITVAGDPQPVPAEEGETILDALLNHGVSFAYSCEAGNCGTCKCEYVSGEIFELERSEHALSLAERERGIILACRTQVWGDVEVRRLSTEEFVMHPSRVMRCRVQDLDTVTYDVLRLRLQIESGGPYTFSAGQFAKLQFPFAPEAVRDYSMANRPDEAILEFHIRSLAGGVSGRLRSQLGVGDTVRVSGPFGTSYLREDHEGPLLAVAGGTGLAPIRSIVSTALNKGLARSIHLYLGVRAERDVYGEAELRDWEQRYPNLKVHIALSDEMPANGRRRHGTVTDVMRADFPDLTGTQAYLAGPPAMVDMAKSLLFADGVPARDVHADAFYSASDPPGKEAA